VFIDQTRGEALSNYLAQTVGATAEIALNSVVFKFPVNDTLQCEHVSLRLRTTHTRRADVRVTLVSPAGTRSVLHHFNRDENSPLDDWTFHSVQHFYECSAGEWRVEVSDEKSGVIGSVTAVDLTIRGVRIQDQDRDGLDDGWEVTNFGNLAARPGEDPDHDGASNLLESLLGTDPRSSGVPLALDLLPWDAQFWRLSSPGTPGTVYRLFAAPEVGGAYSLLGSTEAPFGVAEWIVPADASPGRYFRLEASPKP
jgi:subtilisin-like proprotein convertase family protein